MRQFLINSEEVSVSPTWNLTDQINSRSTFSCTITDIKNAVISKGATFQLLNDGTKIFEGIIYSVLKYEIVGVLEYQIAVVDNSAIADKRRIPKVYENEHAGDIVKDIITEVLNEENVTEGVIQDGPIIKKAVFAYDKCSEALDYLKNVTGFIWNIDKDKQLNFFERSTNVSPFNLTATTQHHDFEQDSSLEDYRNTQYVRGGKGRTSTQNNETPTPKPDGSSKTFVLRFPVAEKPTIEVNLDGAGWVEIPQTDIGVNGIDIDKKWYFTFNSQVITQDDSETTLTTNDLIRITYIGLKNLFTRVENTLEINSRGTIEGNSGIYENLQREPSINDTGAAIDYAQGLILKYGDIKDICSFSTELEGLQAGQLIRIIKPLYSIDDNFLIESVNMYAVDDRTIEYRIKCLDGAAIGGWEEFFKQILRGNRDFTISENEVLIILQSTTEEKGRQGSYDLTIYDALYPENDLYPANDLYPNRNGVEVTLND